MQHVSAKLRKRCIIIVSPLSSLLMQCDMEHENAICSVHTHCVTCLWCVASVCDILDGNASGSLRTSKLSMPFLSGIALCVFKNPVCRLRFVQVVEMDGDRQQGCTMVTNPSTTLHNPQPSPCLVAGRAGWVRGRKKCLYLKSASDVGSLQWVGRLGLAGASNDPLSRASEAMVCPQQRFDNPLPAPLLNHSHILQPARSFVNLPQCPNHGFMLR